MPISVLDFSPGPVALAAQRTVGELPHREYLRGIWTATRFARDDLIQRVVELCEIPSPTFHERKRGNYVSRFFEKELQLEVGEDEDGNRWVLLRGTRGDGPRIMVSAHLDTVFPHSVDCSVRKENGYLIGPGIGDNCSGLSILLTLAKILKDNDCPFPGELLLAANVCEEGLGNLKGIRQLCSRFQDSIHTSLALDGGLGHVVGAAVGCARYRISVTGPGGHSWSDFGRPSAIHHLSKIAAAISSLEVPAEPRTTFNIGIINGGNSINSIASDGELLLDLRSLDAASLAGLEARAQRAACAIPIPKELDMRIEKIGERPTGRAGLTQDWVDVAKAAWGQINIPVQVTASSTDANVPLSLGFRSSTMGTCRGGRAHTTSEWIDPESLPIGLEGILLALLTGLEVFHAHRTS